MLSSAGAARVVHQGPRFCEESMMGGREREGDWGLLQGSESNEDPLTLCCVEKEKLEDR